MSEAAGSGGRRRTPWRAIGWGGAVVLLSIPFVAMRLSIEGVDWSIHDFIAMGVLFGLVGLGIELVVRFGRSRAGRLGAGLAIFTTFLLIWVNLAVGIIGSEDNPANAMYLGVLALLLAGAIVARLRAAGMVVVMVAAALGQAAIAVVALVGGRGAEDPNWPLDTIGVTGLFVFLWLVSAWLFRRAAEANRRG